MAGETLSAYSFLLRQDRNSVSAPDDLEFRNLELSRVHSPQPNDRTARLMQVRTSLKKLYESHSPVSVKAKMLSFGWVEQVQKTSLEQVVTVFFHY